MTFSIRPVKKKPVQKKQQTKTIYIAGPMRGIKHFNFPAFDAAKKQLTAVGWDVMSPADMDRATGFDETAFPDDHDWIDLKKIGFNLRDAVMRDAEALCDCDAIAMLPGWERSSGAQAERAIARWLGLEILYFNSRRDYQAS